MIEDFSLELESCWNINISGNWQTQSYNTTLVFSFKNILVFAYVKKKRILPEENLEEKNEILDHTCRKNSSRRKPSGLGRKANTEI